jgi:hypothetical protein
LHDIASNAGASEENRAIDKAIVKPLFWAALGGRGLLAWGLIFSGFALSGSLNLHTAGTVHQC